MKVIVCEGCNGVTALSYMWRSCLCKQVGGMYRPDDPHKAIVAGRARIYGLSNMAIGVADTPHPRFPDKDVFPYDEETGNITRIEVNPEGTLSIQDYGIDLTPWNMELFEIVAGPDGGDYIQCKIEELYATKDSLDYKRVLHYFLYPQHKMGDIRLLLWKGEMHLIKGHHKIAAATLFGLDTIGGACVRRI